MLGFNPSPGVTSVLDKLTGSYASFTNPSYLYSTYPISYWVMVRNLSFLFFELGSDSCAFFDLACWSEGAPSLCSSLSLDSRVKAYFSLPIFFLLCCSACFYLDRFFFNSLFLLLLQGLLRLSLKSLKFLGEGIKLVSESLLESFFLLYFINSIAVRASLRFFMSLKPYSICLIAVPIFLVSSKGRL